jgi:hypothetical protein
LVIRSCVINSDARHQLIALRTSGSSRQATA